MDTDSQYITDTISANQFPYRTVSHRSKIPYQPIYHSPEHLAFWFQRILVQFILFEKQFSPAPDQFEPQVHGWVNGWRKSVKKCL